MKKKKPTRKSPLLPIQHVTRTANELKSMKLRAVHRRDKLAPAQEKVAREIHRILGEHLVGSFEEFELGFCYDMHPERELVIWYKIAVSLILWRQVHHGYTLEQEKQVCANLLSISTGAKGDDDLTQMYRDSEQEVIRRLKELEEANK